MVSKAKELTYKYMYYVYRSVEYLNILKDIVELILTVGLCILFELN